MGQRILRHRRKAGCNIACRRTTLAGMRPTSLNIRAGRKIVVVDDPYLTAQAATVRERLKMVGVRLGAIINTALVAS